MTQDVAGQTIPARPRGGGDLSCPRLPGVATASSPSNGDFPVSKQGRVAPRPSTWLRALSEQLRRQTYAQLNWWKSCSARSVQGGIGLATFYVRLLREGHYAFARMSNHSLAARHRDRLVWEAPVDTDDHDPTKQCCVRWDVGPREPLAP
jgi:hypothetical protein